MSQSSWYQLDWIWQATGYSLAALGSLLLLWSLFHDRAKGRRRCPKCWYDMRGIPTRRCPECGREPKHERKLLKTRRHWRFALLAVLILAASWMSFSSTALQREGWTGLAPTPAVVATAILSRTPTTETSWPIYLRDSKPTPDPSPRPLTWRETICRGCQMLITDRVKNKAIRPWVLKICSRITWATLDRDLNSYPPGCDWYLKDMLYALSENSHAQRGSNVAPLIAPWFEVMPHPITGCPVYAMVRGIGVGDDYGTVEISTNWPGATSEPVRIETWESELRQSIVHDGFPLHHIVSLGSPPDDARSVHISVKIRRNMSTAHGDFNPSVATRTYTVPIRVQPRETDPLIPIDVDASVIEGQFTPRLINAPYSTVPELAFIRTLVFSEPVDDLPTLGARLEVLDVNRMVIYQAAVCAWRNQICARYSWGDLPGFLITEPRVKLLTPRPAPLSGVTTLAPFTLRIICDPDIARQNPYCTEYYRGTFEIPLPETTRR